jgi:hypothetical protein
MRGLIVLALRTVLLVGCGDSPTTPAARLLRRDPARVEAPPLAHSDFEGGR